MEVRKLVWDSEFFGMHIGRAEVLSEEDAVSLARQREVLKDSYDLIYVFASHGLGFQSFNAKLVD